MKLLVQPPSIPDCAWQRPIGLGWENPYTVRYASNLDDGPWHGMPLGGFGAGCIGRSPRGDFNLWHLDAGEHTFRNAGACQFSVYEQTEEGDVQAYAMATEAPDDGTLESWEWYPTEKGTYSALYPRSWYEYKDVFNVELTCEQFTPIIAESYQETSYPTAVFEWSAHNPTDKPITVSIMMSWQNMVGWFTKATKVPQVELRDDGSPVYEYQSRWGDSTGNLNQWIQDRYRVGCLLTRVRPHDQISEGEGQICFATVTNPTLEVFYHNRWNPSGDGRDVWDYFAANGSLPDVEDETPASPGEQIAGAIAVRFTVRPGRTKKIPFFLAWDFPVMEFAPDITYFRRYTDFFGRSGHNVWSIIRTAMKHSDLWKERIEEWQKPFLSDKNLPDWLKMALCNELYLLTQGGSLWTAATEDDPVGQFGILECLEYRWYESLDVRMYGSFALAMLWPKLDKSILEAFARAIPSSDDTQRAIGYNKLMGYENFMAPRKRAGATPHDLGAPNEHPWEATNYTAYQDCNLWKDLGSDFVLQVYRDYVMTGSKDTEFLWSCWEGVVQALDYLKTFDLDCDGIPENGGSPDQTFDDWKLKGISAYCGGLWIAALEAAIAIAEVLKNNRSIYEAHQNQVTPEEFDAAIAKYQDWLAKSRPLYQDTLWTGSYYKLDSGTESKVVMSDQLCGEFYTQLLKLPNVNPGDRTETTINTIYDACYLKFHDGKFGAANGLNPDGTPEKADDTHPLEVWTGINFGIAAFMIQQGMKDEALKMTEAVVHQVYSNGLQFRTPEAITANNTFRASHYLRAMGIWAVYHALK
ncbi:GH116 family glycosyl hydrolase [[Limnothrix rosea] IAM M-220]|uniref:GH116 family glycosyl hydrolase n=1 Tax=[Limnothrix rosea] IAM M-220 TaxID=454133 RepID=UPI000969FF66|nr:GH116 family glycosyl hydrolase [[Limnothrix rosea] IAM M-220]OKH17076.1 bile acid beta-glucosidase [[Limnothrix rosea] IAM M-220]